MELCSNRGRLSGSARDLGSAIFVRAGPIDQIPTAAGRIRASIKTRAR